MKTYYSEKWETELTFISPADAEDMIQIDWFLDGDIMIDIMEDPETHELYYTIFG